MEQLLKALGNLHELSIEMRNIADDYNEVTETTLQKETQRIEKIYQEIGIQIESFKNDKQQ